MLRNTENYLVWEEKIQWRTGSRDSESCCYFIFLVNPLKVPCEVFWSTRMQNVTGKSFFCHWFTFYKFWANMSYEYWFHTWFQVKYQYLDILYPRGNLGGISTRKTWGMTDAIYLLKCEVSHIEFGRISGKMWILSDFQVWCEISHIQFTFIAVLVGFAWLVICIGSNIHS